jgi:hypothetical protein
MIEWTKKPSHTTVPLNTAEITSEFAATCLASSSRLEFSNLKKRNIMSGLRLTKIFLDGLVVEKTLQGVPKNSR